MRTVATIGVYGFTADAFLEALRAAKVQRVLDVRQGEAQARVRAHTSA